jgi:hypothetical protein
MSTPSERYRAIVECREFLVAVAVAVAVAAGVPAEQRAQAQDLAEEYPSAGQICDWITADVPDLPIQMARAIDRASVLLHVIRPQDWANKLLSRRAIGILRHYPLVPISDRLADHVFFGGSLREYVSPD